MDRAWVFATSALAVGAFYWSANARTRQTTPHKLLSVGAGVSAAAVAHRFPRTGVAVAPVLAGFYVHGLMNAFNPRG